MKRKYLTLAISAVVLTLSIIAGLCFIIYADDAPAVYLSDLTPKTAQAGWSTVHFDEDLNGGALRLNNAGEAMTFEKGLFAHVDSLIEYDISSLPVDKLTAYIGINDGSQGYKDQASSDFEVKADGVSIYKSDILRIDSKAEFIEVEIPEGTKVLSLITTKADHTNYADHTAWCDAKLVLDASAGDMLHSVDATVSAGLLTVGDTAKIDVSAYAYGGGTIEAGKLDITYKSSSEAVATVSADGVITAKGAGEATVTVTVKKDMLTSTATVKVRCLAKNSTSDFLVSSPSGNVSILLSNTANGLRYSVMKGNVTVIEPSVIGFKGTGFSLEKGFTYSSKTDVKEVDETYKKYSGSYSEGRDHYNEQSVTFTNGNYKYTVILRAYDDGFAYRSVISKKDGGEATLTITDEVTNFVFPAGTTVWSSEVSSLSQTYSYESGFPAMAIENTMGKHLMFAALCRVSDDVYTLINEADLYGDSYYGSSIDGEGGNALGLVSAPQESSSIKVSLDPDFTSPWRYGVVGDLETIVESDLTENLNPRAEGDFSWVEPGVTAWMWLSEGFNGQRSEETIKEYVDLAAEMGWKYLILDEGWQPSSNFSVTGKYYDGYFDYFEDLIDYAESKGVGFIAWVKFRDLDTPEEREILAEWADMGIKGIKGDFFESESVERIDGIEAIYAKCAEEHLIVNIHGANKPTGERSTWPNVINRESLKGQEYGGVWSSDTTIWPYTRAVIGPMDITPHLYPTDSSSTTASQQLALNVMFESGMPCMASDTSVYYNSNVKALLKNLPCAWDDLEFIEGQVSRYTVLARRAGNSWYVAGVTQNEQDVELTFDFLEAGEKYVATVFCDKSRHEIDVYSVNVTSESTLDLTMSTYGGFTVMIRPASEVKLAESITVDKPVVTLKPGESTKVNFTYAPANADVCDILLTQSDDAIATVSEDGTITAKNSGVTYVTLTSPQAGVSATVEVRVYEEDGGYGMSVYSIKQGRSAQVVASKIVGDSSLSDLEYKITNENIATVDETGRVYGVKPGVTTLVAKNKATGQSERLVIQVYLERSTDSGIWEVINPTNNDKSPVVSESTPKKLQMTILTGDINGAPQNLFLTDAPEGDFEITVKLSGGLNKDFQSIGLVAYNDRGSMVTMERRSHSYFGGNVFCLSTSTNGSYQEHYTAETKSSSSAYVKMTKQGNVFTGYFSYDGENWTKIAKTITSPSVAGSADLKIGLIARSGSYGAEKVVTYENFTLNGTLIPFIPDEEVCQLLSEETITLEVGGKLPETLKAYVNTGKIVDVNVTWDDDEVDFNTVGEYTATATAEGGLSVTVKVAVSNGGQVTPPEPPAPITGDSTVWAMIGLVISLGIMLVIIKRKKAYNI